MGTQRTSTLASGNFFDRSVRAWQGCQANQITWSLPPPVLAAVVFVAAGAVVFVAAAGAVVFVAAGGAVVLVGAGGTGVTVAVPVSQAASRGATSSSKASKDR